MRTSSDSFGKLLRSLKTNVQIANALNVDMIIDVSLFRFIAVRADAACAAQAGLSPRKLHIRPHFYRHASPSTLIRQPC